MKGVMSSVIVLVSFLSVLLVVIAFSADIQGNFDVVNFNALNDRIFYKFSAIEHSIIRIMENDLARSGLKVTIKEGPYNFITINATLPSVKGNFSQDIINLERFAETKLNESNLVIDLNVSGISNCLPLMIMPYNITFGTYNQGSGVCGFGTNQRNLRIDSNGTAPTFLNGYNMTVVVNRSRINPASASWTPPGDCTGGTLNWTIRVIGNGTSSGMPLSSYGPVTNMIRKDGECSFRINEDVTNLNILQVNNSPKVSDSDATLVVGVQAPFRASFMVTLNLTDVPGKLRVSLSPQSIKIRETLFQVERNDTAVIQ